MENNNKETTEKEERDTFDIDYLTCCLNRSTDDYPDRDAY